MAVGVVDPLEAVDVEQGQREGAAAAFGARDLQLHPGHQRAAVWQVGQRVGRGHKLQIFGEFDRLLMAHRRAEARIGHQQDDDQSRGGHGIIVAVVIGVGDEAVLTARGQQPPLLSLDQAKGAEEVDDPAAVHLRAYPGDRVGVATRSLQPDQHVDRRDILIQLRPGGCQACLLGGIVARQPDQPAQQQMALCPAAEIGREGPMVVGEQVAARAAHRLVDRGLQLAGDEQHLERVPLPALGLAPLLRYPKAVGDDQGEQSRDGDQRAEAEQPSAASFLLEDDGAVEQSLTPASTGPESRGSS